MRPVRIPLALIFLLALCALIGAFYLFANAPTVLAATCNDQTPNLLINGTMSGSDANQLADNWNKFVVSGVPIFQHVSNEGWDPGGSQMIYQYDNGGNPNALFDAGVYQVVSGLTVNGTYHACFIWGQTQHDVMGTLTTGHFNRQLGIDPYGGTSPTSQNVIWSVPYTGASGFARTEWNLDYRAVTTRTTFFLRAQNLDPTWGNKVFFDAVHLYLNNGQPTSTAWATASNSPTATATGTGTTPTQTSTPTITPTPTLTPTPTQTTVPILNASACNFSKLKTIGPLAGASPKGITVDPVTNRVYVASYKANGIGVIDASLNLTAVYSSTNASGGANDVALQNGNLYVTMKTTGIVARFRASDGAFLSKINVGSEPYGIGGSNNRLWVANFASDTDSILDALSNTNVITPTAGDQPALVATLNGIAYVTFYGGGILVLDANGNALDTLSVGDGAYGVAVNPIANRVYATTRTLKNILIFDATTHALINSTTTPHTPYAIAVNPMTNHLFVVFAQDPGTPNDIPINQLGVYDATTLAPVATLTLDSQGTGGGDGIAVLNNRVFVSNNAADSLTVFADFCFTRSYVPSLFDAHP